MFSNKIVARRIESHKGIGDHFFSMRVRRPQGPFVHVAAGFGVGVSTGVIRDYRNGLPGWKQTWQLRYPYIGNPGSRCQDSRFPYRRLYGSTGVGGKTSPWVRLEICSRPPIRMEAPWRSI